MRRTQIEHAVKTFCDVAHYYQQVYVVLYVNCPGFAIIDAFWRTYRRCEAYSPNMKLHSSIKFQALLARLRRSSPLQCCIDFDDSSSIIHTSVLSSSSSCEESLAAKGGQLQSWTGSLPAQVERTRFWKARQKTCRQIVFISIAPFVFLCVLHRMVAAIAHCI